MAFLKYKLRGSTLIEATIAMVIIVIVFSTGWMVLGYNLSDTSASRERRALALIAEARLVIQKKQEISNPILSKGGINITGFTQFYPTAPETPIIQLVATTEGGIPIIDTYYVAK